VGAEGLGERLPKGAIARMGSKRLRHGDAVVSAAYTPDGTALLTASRDSTVRLWALATGREICRFDWGDVQPARASEPGEDGALQKYGQQTSAWLAWGCHAAISSDGKMVAACRGGAICLWLAATGKKLRDLHTGHEWLAQLKFSADGRSLLTAGPGQTTAVWDVATGKCVQRSRNKPATRVRDWTDVLKQTAVVSPGWKYVAWQHYPPPNAPTLIRIRDLTSDIELPAINTTIEATALTFSPDAKRVVWAQFKGPIMVSEVATGKELRRLGGQGDIVTALVHSADGKSLAVCRERYLELWDMASGKQTCRIEQSAWANDAIPWQVRPALAFSPDGKDLVAGRGVVTIRQFRADTGKEIQVPAAGHRAPVSQLALSADGKSVWTYGHGDPIRCWDWATGREIEQRQLPAATTLAVFGADCRNAYATENQVALCDEAGQQILKVAIGASPLAAIALSADGKLLAARSNLSRGDPLGIREVHVWNVTTGKEPYTLGPGGNLPPIAGEIVTETTGVVSPDLVFSHDGRCLAGAGPGRQLCLWDVATGNVLWELSPQAGQAIERFAFSPNGCVLASVHVDQTVTLYEAASGSKRARLGMADPKNRTVHLTDSYKDRSETTWRPDAPICLAFSPDGRYLATAKDTADIRLWDVVAGQKIGQLTCQDGGIVSLLFTADGKHLISGGTDTTALTWDVARLTSAGPRSLERRARLESRDLDALWTDLDGKDAARAFEAIRKLSAAPDQAVKLLQERVRPATPAEPKRLAQLLFDLESDRFELRRQAESELQRLGELAGPALRKAMHADLSLDLRKRLERLLDKLSIPTVAPLREVRAVELLELIGSPDARQVLNSLAEGAPSARLTEQAREAMQRLARRAVLP
jgi:WD40 repeat protein